MLIVSVRRGLN